jgi:hypothetical protein
LSAPRCDESPSPTAAGESRAAAGGAVENDPVTRQRHVLRTMRHGKSAAGVRHGTALPHEPGHASCTRPALSVTAALNLQHVHPVRLGTVTPHPPGIGRRCGPAVGPFCGRFAAAKRSASAQRPRSGRKAARAPLEQQIFPCARVGAHLRVVQDGQPAESRRRPRADGRPSSGTGVDQTRTDRARHAAAAPGRTPWASLW